jgi:hypothetical protein
MQTQQIKVRLPADADAFIEAEARKNSSSKNSEIVRAVRERMESVAGSVVTKAE